MTALAIAAAGVLLVASPATAEDAQPCVPAAVPESGAEAAPVHSAEMRRFVELLVQVLQPDAAAGGNQPPAPTLDGAGAQALLGQLACQTGEDPPNPAGTTELPDTGLRNCVTYTIGPDESPDWPILDALGIRELIEESSGVATVCVAGDPATPPAGGPSTTAVEPQTQPPVQQHNRTTSSVRVESRLDILPQPGTSAQVNVESDGRSLLQAVGITGLLRQLIGR